MLVQGTETLLQKNSSSIQILKISIQQVTLEAGTTERASKDQIVNARVSFLLDFLACNKLQILNGCTLGDILGEYTSVNYNGCSVVFGYYFISLSSYHIIHHHYHNYHLIISHHHAHGYFENLNYYIRTYFFFDEELTKLNFNDFLTFLF